jgi:hypothetical protein
MVLCTYASCYQPCLGDFYQPGTGSGTPQHSFEAHPSRLLLLCLIDRRSIDLHVVVVVVIIFGAGGWLGVIRTEVCLGDARLSKVAAWRCGSDGLFARSSNGENCLAAVFGVDDCPLLYYHTSRKNSSSG